MTDHDDETAKVTVTIVINPVSEDLICIYRTECLLYDDPNTADNVARMNPQDLSDPGMFDLVVDTVVDNLTLQGNYITSADLPRLTERM